MRRVGLLTAFLLCATMVLGVTSLTGQDVDLEKDYGKAKLLLGDAKRAAQAGGEASTLEKYGEALIMLRQIGVKGPSWKQGEVSASIAEAEAGYVRTLTGMVVKLQNASIQRGEIAKQQARILAKIGALMTKNEEMMKYLVENRDLIEKVDSALRP